MGRCWSGTGTPCGLETAVQLIAPDGTPIGWLCRQCAQECIDEYREKLGETWSIAEDGGDSEGN